MHAEEPRVASSAAVRRLKWQDGRNPAPAYVLSGVRMLMGWIDDAYVPRARNVAGLA
jgi:hypothetical protein